MPHVGPNYSYAQLEQIWINNGGSAATAPIAAAIATAESGGGAGSYDDDSNGSVDRGLWQINSVHGAESTFDVNANAQAAVAISNNGTNWKPWTTFTSGAYLRYLQQGVPPASAGVPAGGSGPSSGSGSISGSVTTAASTSDTDPNCLIGWSGISALDNAGSFCLITKAEMRTMVGGILIIVGGGLALAAVILLIRGSIPATPPLPTPSAPSAQTRAWWTRTYPAAQPPTPAAPPNTPAIAAPVRATSVRVTPGRPARTTTMLNRPITIGAKKRT